MVTSYVDRIYPKPHKLGRQRRQEFLFPPRIADLQNDALALDVAQLIQTLSKGDEANSGLGCSEDNRPDSNTFPAVCCPSPTSAAKVTLTVRTTANPIRRMDTSVGMAGGSLADDGSTQELAALVEHVLLDDLVRPPQH